MKSSVSDSLISVFLLSIFTAIYIHTAGFPRDVARFPNFILICLLILSALLLIRSLKELFQQKNVIGNIKAEILSFIKKEKDYSFLVYLVTITVYVLIIDIIGFYPASFLFLLVSVKLLGDSLKTSIVVASVFSLAVYLCFTFWLRINFPTFF